MICSVSMGSTTLSSRIGTRTVRTVRPGSNDKVALKTFGVPGLAPCQALEVARVRVTGRVLGPLSSISVWA